MTMALQVQPGRLRVLVLLLFDGGTMGSVDAGEADPGGGCTFEGRHFSCGCAFALRAPFVLGDLAMRVSVV
jgi:hypothetical protein